MKKITLIFLIMVGAFFLPKDLFAQPTTTWNGFLWDNGPPFPSSRAIIDGQYITADNGNIDCYNLLVTSIGQLKISNGTSVTVTDSVRNEGIINESCNITFTYNTLYEPGGTRTNYPPEIAMPSNSYFEFTIGQNAAYYFYAAANATSPNWTSDPLPNGLIMFNSGELSGTADLSLTPDTIPVIIRLEEFPCFGTYSSTAIYIVIKEPTVPGYSPNLSVDDIFMSYSQFGSKEPAVNAPNDVNTYRVNTFSRGAITYEILPANECAYIDPYNGRIYTTCAGPISQYSVVANQAADGGFDAASDTATLYLSKGTPDLSLRTSNASFLVGVPGFIDVYTNSDGAVSFTQISDGSVATINSIGEVTPITEGTFEVIITVAETDNYFGYSIYERLNVFLTAQPPVATDDTIEVGVGEEFSVNILDNDLSYMAQIDTTQIDIDMENPGTQGKYLDPSSGTFLIDSLGVLHCKPFRGALGVFYLYYTISDKQYNQSYPGKVTINIVQKGEAPELKATELITPNNDGLNDAFVIGYVDHAKTNFLKVFDRNGSEIVSIDNYDNDWEGTGKNGKSLESGVYYYLFNQNGEKEIQGMIEIRR